MSKTEQLLAVTRNESLSAAERKTAATLYIRELVDAVPAPADDDADVVKRMQPWEPSPIRELFASGPFGKMVDGLSLADAKAEVLKRHRVSSVLGVVVDDDLPHAVRLAGCAWVLAECGIRYWSMNNFTPERLLETILPVTATKYAKLFQPFVPVERPPRLLQDVWSF